MQSLSDSVWKGRYTVEPESKEMPRYCSLPSGSPGQHQARPRALGTPRRINQPCMAGHKRARQRCAPASWLYCLLRSRLARAHLAALGRCQRCQPPCSQQEKRFGGSRATYHSTTGAGLERVALDIHRHSSVCRVGTIVVDKLLRPAQGERGVTRTPSANRRRAIPGRRVPPVLHCRVAQCRPDP